MSGRPVDRWTGVSVIAWALVVAWFCAVNAPVVLHGYFLSDDFVPLVLFREWSARGVLWHQLAAKFWSGLDAGANHFYRPLSYLTFALNDLASGIDARPWLATQVILHASSGGLVAAIVMSVSPGEPRSRAWASAAVAAALFLFAAPGVEVSAWISGRFDAMATVFSLASVLAFLHSARRFDAAWWLSLGAMVAACLSKESAAIVPAAVVLLAWARDESPWPRKARSVLSVAWPWLAIAVVYLLARAAMFGSPTAVYGGVDPARNVVSREYWHSLGEALFTFLRAQFRPAALYPGMAALTALQVAIGLLAPASTPARRFSRACLGTALVSLALTLPYMPYLPATGLGGRLLYQAWAFYAVFAGVALASVAWTRAAWAASLALVATHAVFHASAIARWDAAFVQMRALVADLRRVEREVPTDGYALALVPGGLGAVPFGRNAQAGLMLPPIQPHDMSRRLLVQVYPELLDLAGKLRDGVVPTLKTQGLDGYAAGRRTTVGAIYPTSVHCWSTVSRRLVPLEAGDTGSPEAWVASLRRALAASTCDASG